jgi:PGAP1-like protein
MLRPAVLISRALSMLVALGCCGLASAQAPINAALAVDGLIGTGGARVAKSSMTQAVAGCPNNTGLLDSVSVPVNQPLDLRVVTSAPAPAGGATFQLSSDNATLVAAGDRLQGFLPVVTVPAGQTNSNAFRVFGIKVGRTTLRAVPLTAGFTGFATPITAWDLNPGAPDDKKFVDANPPSNTCRVDANSVAFSRDATKISGCGKNVEGAAADGLSKLLLRVGAGISGTACYEIVSTSPDDQGALDTAVAPLAAATGGLQFGSSYFTAPPNYGSSGGERRQIEVELSYTTNIGNGNTSRVRYKTFIVRPPVVLVHGLWGTNTSFSEWSNYQPEGDFRTILSADYGATNASLFSTNRAVLAPFITQALNLHRRRFAATRVDLISHSMGGIVSRLHIGGSTFKTPQNLNEGDVRRLLTLVTPHQGSSFANLLVALHSANAADTVRVARDVAGGNVAGGAVCDLAENSTGLRLPELGAGTALRSQVYSATGGPAGTPAAPAQFFGGRLGRGNFEGALTERRCSRTLLGICTERLGPFLFPQATVNAFRFIQANDTVVPLVSQLGGLAAAGANFPTVIHSGGSGLGGLVVVDGMTNTRAVATAAFVLLDGADTGFATSLTGISSTGTGEPSTVPGRGAALDRADYASQCGAGGPLGRRAEAAMRSSAQATAPSPDLSVIAPADGQNFIAGTNLPITGLLGASLQATELGFTLGGGIGFVDAVSRNNLQYQLNYTLPADLAGRISITPVARDSGGGLIEGAPVTVNVLPPGGLAELNFLRPAFHLPPGAPPQQLVLRGRFASQTAPQGMDLTGAGALFTSSNNSVLLVDAVGKVTVVGPGLASVKGTYGGLVAYSTFIVENSASPIPAQELTGLLTVSASGFQLNRSTGFYVQSVTLVNSSDAALPAPLFLSINNLTPGVSLVGSAVGQTLNVPPAQTPYVSLALPKQTLAPGQQVTVQLQFLNPARTRITYGPKIYWTDGQP